MLVLVDYALFRCQAHINRLAFDCIKGSITILLGTPLDVYVASEYKQLNVVPLRCIQSVRKTFSMTFKKVSFSESSHDFERLEEIFLYLDRTAGVA